MKKNSMILGTMMFIVLFWGFQMATDASANQIGTIWGINFNLFSYAMILLVSFGAYIILNVIVEKNILKLRISNEASNIINIEIALVAIVYLYCVYKNEVDFLYAGADLRRSFVRENVEHIWFAILVIVACILVGCLVRSVNECPKGFRKITAIFFSLLGGLFSFAPNIYQNDMWGLWHIHAYTNSIVNTMFLQPYSDVNCSIYGHYGLIYYPFVKVLGNDYTAIAITIALFVGITYFLWLYVIDRLIKHDGLYFLTAFAIIGTSTTYFGAGNYFQGLPCRCLFPTIAIAYIVRNEMKEFKHRYLIEVLVGTIAIIFNLESGLGAVAIIFVYEIVTEKFRICDVIKKIIKMIGYVIACFGLAYLIVNLYNIACQGTWNSLRSFIYPLGSTEYDMSAILQTPIQNPFGGYMPQLFVFVICAFTAVYEIWFQDQTKGKQRIILSIAVSGLVMLVYFMNRSAASNLFLTHAQFIVLLTICADYIFSHDVKFNVRNIIQIDSSGVQKWVIAAMASFLALFFAIESAVSIGSITSNRGRSTWNCDTLNSDYERLVSWIPNDVPAFGMGVPELYYELGRETGVYVTDWADMNDSSLTEISKVLGEIDSVVVSRETARRWQIEAMLNWYDYQEMDCFDGKIFSLVYYEKKK